MGRWEGGKGCPELVCPLRSCVGEGGVGVGDLYSEVLLIPGKNSALVVLAGRREDGHVLLVE